PHGSPREPRPKRLPADGAGCSIRSGVGGSPAGSDVASRLSRERGAVTGVTASLLVSAALAGGCAPGIASRRPTSRRGKPGSGGDFVAIQRRERPVTTSCVSGTNEG